MDANPLNPDEALDRIAQILGCKWSTRILSSLCAGERRPSEMLRECDEMAARVLHRCLNRLLSDGLITKQTFAEVPVRVEYELTDQGREFTALLEKATKISCAWQGTLKRVENPDLD
jgi:DNA-binding HxlR family transcriptional regulator